MNPRRVKGVLARHLYTLRHSPPAWFDMLFWPFMDLLLWGLVTSFIVRQGIEVPLPVGFLLGGVLLWDLMFRSANGVGIAFLEDTSWSHNILNLLVSPLKATEYLAGIVSFALSKVVFGWIVMIGLAWLLFSFSILEVGLPLAMFMLALMVFGVAVSMVIIGIALRFGPGADILAWGLVFLLMPVSAVYYPVEVLPGWLEGVARALPPAHIFESMRAVLAGAPAPWGSFALAMGLNAVYIAAGVLFAYMMLKTLRQRGFVTRYM